MTEAAVPTTSETTQADPQHRLIDLILARFRGVDATRRGVCLINAGKYDDAIASFTTAQELSGSDSKLSTYIAACHIGRNEPQRAALELEAAVDAGDATAVTCIRHSLALWSAGQADTAVKSLRDGIRRDADCAELHFQLGTLLGAQEQYQEAELRFTQTLSIDRDHTEALVSLAMCHAARGEIDEALPLLQRAQTVRPNDARIGLLLAQGAQVAQQQGRSVRLCATVDAPETTDQKSLEELSHLIESDPDFVDAFLALPQEEVDAEVLRMLLTTLRLALERQPQHAELHVHCGRILDRLGRKNDAIDENERAVTIDPQCARALIELGRLYHDTDRTEDATTRLEQAIRAGAEYADVYFLLGNLYRTQGHLQRARSAYRHAIAINERYEAAHSALAALPS